MTPYTLSRAQFDELRAQFDPDIDIRDDYSGRGMYGRHGRHCIGYVGDDPLRFGFELAVLLADDPYGDSGVDDVRDAIDSMGCVVSDSMGCDTIWYWPDVSVEPAGVRT
jgi:hypothetical protein